MMRSAVALGLCVLSACSYKDPGLSGADAPPGGSADAAPADARTDACSGGCQLWSADRSVAATGDTLVLDGSFAAPTVVHFPGGADVTVSNPGTHRLAVTVPSDATAGLLTVEVGGQVVGALPFRRASFALGLNPFSAFVDDQAAAARQMPTLEVPRVYAANVVAGGYFYVIGGSTNDAIVGTIERARIGADGSLSSFETVVSHLETPREFAQAVVIGGFVYVIAGANQSTLTPLATVERAPILQDGSLGSFAVVPGVTLKTERITHSALVVGDELYVIGGFNGGPLKSIERAPISADGSLGAFTTVSAGLTVGRNAAAVVKIGPFLYIIGGHVDGQPSLDSVERAVLGPDGSLGPFSLVPGLQLATARDSCSAIALGSSLYVIGGQANVGFSSVEQAAIAADGSIGAFATAPALTLHTPRVAYASLLVGNFLYLVGGSNGSVLATVERASIDRGSQVSAFSAAAPALGTARHFAASAVIGGSYYVFGGFAGGADLKSIERAPIAPDGALGAFTAAGNLVQARHVAGVVVTGPFVYVLAGLSNADQNQTVERASINADGSVGPFAIVSGVTLSRTDFSPVVLGNTLYVIGGSNQTAGGENDVLASTIASDGSLGAFATVSGVTTPAKHNGASTVVIGSKLYAMGGTGTGVNADIDVATIAGSSISNFASGGTLPVGLDHAGTAVIGNAVFLLGGHTPTGDVTTVRRALVGADGVTLGAFAIVPGVALPTALIAPQTAVVGNHISIVGGQSAAGSSLSAVATATLQ